ncbi:alpha-keto acid decarboxylase family protein [Bacillus sp. Marseille-P3800]|uniref:alpha-keto acid decarboxylase family protein n=1 Tax=Bacillus sp. Marseille-P3800 TaxID=2014782 RepID=UPI000C074400|nr:thiamine pyrophosphate-binding protein [Bacillus sp. Marseille-P3800]
MASDQTETIGDYLYEALRKEGIKDVFGVPGDYNFALLDTLERTDGLRFIHNRNELNAGYAADGYARLHGISALVTAFGVGELSAANAIAGANCENIPIIHIVGAPDRDKQAKGLQVHHTLMNGDFGIFKRMFAEISAYSTVVTPSNARTEITKAIQLAKDYQKPVYLMIADDLTNESILEEETNSIEAFETDQQTLAQAIRHLDVKLKESKKPVLLVDTKVKSFELEKMIQTVTKTFHIPVASMMYGKGSVDESLEEYIGLYAGDFGSHEVRDIVEQSDCVIGVGLVWADTNTANFTASIQKEQLIDIQPHYVRVEHATYEQVKAYDVLKQIGQLDLSKNESYQRTISFPYGSGEEVEDGPLRAKQYYPMLQDFIKEEDVVVVETGTFFYGMSQARMKKGVSYLKQGGWQSIGFATAAAFGASIAAPSRRTLLFTGDGSLQLTAQEISSMLYYDCKPIIFILNNQGYTIEKYLNTETKEQDYNEIPQWNYEALLEGFGGGASSFTAKTTTELKEVLQKVNEVDQLCVVELVVDDPMDAPDYVKQIRAFKKEE